MARTTRSATPRGRAAEGPVPSAGGRPAGGPAPTPSAAYQRRHRAETRLTALVA